MVGILRQTVAVARLACHPKLALVPGERRMVDQTGIEPVTS
jgi:hypothetical protein